MEFGAIRQADLSGDDQMGKVQLHFSFSSSSSSPSPSMLPLTTNPNPNWEHQQQMGCCSASAIKCDPSEEQEASTKLDLMDTSRRINDDDVRSATVTTHIQMEHMFDKVVTPSDVGKLNRLVIPKQHAEKFFPLDSSSNEKGLLLNFEDRNGKQWRFRYSYWNSSQSYVMTKGWSRFVKDKKLDAGDIVSFQRSVGELGKDRLYIDWRRRPDAPELTATFPLQHHLSFQRPIPWSSVLMRPQLAGMARDHSFHLSQTNNYLNRNSYYNNNGGYTYGSNSGGPGGGVVVSPCSMGSIIYLRSQPAAAVVEPQQRVQMEMGMVDWRQQHPMVFDSVPVVQGKAAASAKKLRLFGVNMECPMTESDDECDILSSTSIQHLPTITIEHPYSSSSQSHLQSQFPPIDFLNKGKASMSFDHKF